jgi:spore coat polysaccharide biosynthesis protein SpsF (cytidylyltransferase family)
MNNVKKNPNWNIIAILQARVSSSRLPGKVLKPILGKPMLSLQIERVRRSSLVDQLIVATSNDRTDDPLEDLCRRMGVECFRGRLGNVLDRYYQCAKQYKPQVVVRLTGDCPLADHEVMDGAIHFFLNNGYDYVTNGGEEPTFPDGLDVEVFTFSALKSAWENAGLPSEKEHVTPYIRNHPERFALGVYRGERDLSGLRWTVDEPEDFDFVTRIYEQLYPNDPAFTTADILNLLDRNPELSLMNSGIERNEGMKKSLVLDKLHLKNGKIKQ